MKKTKVKQKKKWEQIEVLGQFDIRRNYVESANNEDKEWKVNLKGDRANDLTEECADSSLINEFDKQPVKHYISRKDSPVRNFCDDIAGLTREESIKMFNGIVWDSWVACNVMPKSAKQWFEARLNEYLKGTNIDLVCDCRKFRGNDANVTQASEITRAEYPHDCHGYTLKKYIEFIAKKSNN